MGGKNRVEGIASPVRLASLMHDWRRNLFMGELNSTKEKPRGALSGSFSGEKSTVCRSREKVHLKREKMFERERHFRVRIRTFFDNNKC